VGERGMAIDLEPGRWRPSDRPWYVYRPMGSKRQVLAAIALAMLSACAHPSKKPGKVVVTETKTEIAGPPRSLPTGSAPRVGGPVIHPGGGAGGFAGP
jgi:hypothetical protein